MRRGFGRSNETASWGSGRARREADRFFADLMGSPPARRRAPVGMRAIDLGPSGFVDQAAPGPVHPEAAAPACGCSARAARAPPEEQQQEERSALAGGKGEGEAWDDPPTDDDVHPAPDAEDDEAEQEPRAMVAWLAEGSVAPALLPFHCVELSTFRTVPITVDGEHTTVTAATASAPPEYSLPSPVRIHTLADLDASFPVERMPTPTAGELLVSSRGRVLLDMGFLRIDPGDASRFQTRVRGLACHPSDPAHPDQLPPGDERFPVAVFVHGQHFAIDAFDLADAGRPRRSALEGGARVTLIEARAILRHDVPSYRGYRYLQEHLAARGIVSVSVDTNAANSLDSLFRFRADLTLAMLDHLRELDATPGSPFHDRLDFSRVALVGHSRGGDAVTMSAHLNGSRPEATRYGVRAVVAIAPTDFTGLLTPSSARVTMTGGATDSFLCVYGSHDGDVSGRFRPSELSQGWGSVGTAFRHFDRATTQRAMVFIHGATHDRFNSVWVDPAAHLAGSLGRTLALAQADNEDDAKSVDPALPPSTAFPLPAGHRDARVLQLGAHQTLAREYVGGWLALWLKGEWQEGDRFTGARANSLGAPVSLQWKLGRRTQTVDNFDDANPARNVVGGAVTLPAFVRERLVELSDLPHSPHHDRTLEAGPPTGAARVYRSVLPPAERDWTGFSALTFRISKDFPDVSSPAAIAAAAFPPTFEIALFDGVTRRAVDQAAIAPLNPMTVRPYHRLMGGLDLTKVPLQTWQVPLSRFAGAGGVSLASVQAVEIAFVAVAGERIHLDTLSLVQV